MDKDKKFEDLNFAKLDTDRLDRTGFMEVVFCQGKSNSQLAEIYDTLLKKYGEVFGTRASKEQYEAVKKVIPEIIYDETSKLLYLEKADKKLVGNVVVCTAGTSDIPVAEEAAKTAEFFGTKVNRIYDIGVSGLHRLLKFEKELKEANCIVAVAGMEGALPSVLGGLVSNPIVAVPTSIGYGASLQGMTALLTMINSCANGISVVNIDNGYGAGYIATQINRLAVK
ncbi:MAG: nickel pincer cofactor biosynthesis protein LarB [Lachnospiraceae bacterium]|nr:nickel pincer cofactor biosynthesis protein LarB [Lachnospiraceae bacterium]